jgi:hypothetical protein
MESRSCPGPTLGRGRELKRTEWTMNSRMHWVLDTHICGRSYFGILGLNSILLVNTWSGMHPEQDILEEESVYLGEGDGCFSEDLEEDHTREVCQEPRRG